MSGRMQTGTTVLTVLTANVQKRHYPSSVQDGTQVDAGGGSNGGVGAQWEDTDTKGEGVRMSGECSCEDHLETRSNGLDRITTVASRE